MQLTIIIINSILFSLGLLLGLAGVFSAYFSADKDNANE